jgi:hypothetical protein
MRDIGAAPVLRRFHHWAGPAVVAALIAAPAHAADFLKAIDDVPLIAGLTELAEPLVFESDQGRVVRTSAEGRLGRVEISTFYLAALPALGWRRLDGADGLAFERENERLNIEVREYASNRLVEVRFELIVKLASTRLPE